MIITDTTNKVYPYIVVFRESETRDREQQTVYCL